jgi:hypothetical protein
MSTSQQTPSSASVPRLVRRSSARYVTEKIEAYNVAIEALRMHESADPDPDGLDCKLRERLADKLDREIQRWVNSLPNQ